MTHSLEGSDFHGHLPAVCTDQRPLWDLISQYSGPLCTVAEHPASPVPLTEKGPHGTTILVFSSGWVREAPSTFKV